MKVGMARLRESGFLDSIMHSYMGPTYRAIPDHSANPLTVHLMVLLFVFLGSVALVLSPMILLIERLWMKLPRNQDPAPGCKESYEEKMCPQCACRQIVKKVCVE